jgi:hypothetical protein
LTENQTHLSRQEIHELIQRLVFQICPSFILLYQYLDRYLQRFQDELEQIELKNQIGQRQKTPQYASRKALIESTIQTEQHEYQTNGFGISD